MPASAWWGERGEGAALEADLNALETEIETLTQRRDDLYTDAKVEEIARAEHGLEDAERGAQVLLRLGPPLRTDERFAQETVRHASRHRDGRHVRLRHA